MAVQDSYSANIRPAVAGMQADMTPSTIISREVESASIAFGRVVYQGTASRQVLDGGAGGFTVAKYVGFAVRDRSALGIPVANAFNQKESARIMTKGTIWVTPAQNVVAGDPVYVRPSNGDLQKDNTNSALQIPGARWEDAATAGAGVLAIIRLS
jgi:hypothetical protein